MATRRHDDPQTTASAPGGPSAPASGDAKAPAGAGSDLPRSKLLTDDERFKSLLAQVHGHGG
jgi:hypothetical protein